MANSSCILEVGADTELHEVRRRSARQCTVPPHPPEGLDSGSDTEIKSGCVPAWVTLVRAAGTTLRAVAVVSQYRLSVHTPGAAHFGVDPTDVPVPVSGKAVRPGRSTCRSLAEGDCRLAVGDCRIVARDCRAATGDCRVAAADTAVHGFPIAPQ